MILRTPSEFIFQTDTAHLKSSPADRKEAGVVRDSVLLTYTGLRSKPKAPMQDTEMEEASSTEKTSPPKAKPTKRKESKAASRGRKNTAGTASTKKKSSQNPSSGGISRGWQRHGLRKLFAKARPPWRDLP